MNSASTARKLTNDQDMRRLLHLSSPSFALISVLALVSLAALTATAFLASAKLERQATGSLSRTVQLEMALTAGERCAEHTMGDGIQPSGGPNFVTTLYRGPGVNDWTNEDGYLFIGQPNSTNNLRWKYFAGFSPATLKKLDTNVIESSIRWTNSQQGAFTSEISTFMNGATNGFSTNPSVASTSKICTLLPLLGGRTSLPVGWVYLYQDKRIFGTTNTTNIPVARVAWFMEDLAGKIDVERMGSLGTRNTGTNPEEISLANMLRPGGGNVLNDLTKITNSTNRKLFFTPGLLANANLSGLTNTNDLRYFATGLREWRPINKDGNNGAVSWIPGGIFSYVSNGTAFGYRNSGYLKMDLNQAVAKKTVVGISDFIESNLPNFTNRAGGMNGTAYVTALAANIIDYVDTDSTPTTTNINGVNIVGFDNYPMLTHVYDSFLYSSTAGNITHTTWMQFWNPSTQTTPSNTITVNFTNNDIVKYLTNTLPAFSTNFVTNRLSLSPVYSTSGLTSANFNIPAISANAGYVTNFVRPTISCADFPNFPTPGPANIYLNTQKDKNDPLPRAIAISNSFSFTIDGKTISPAMLLLRQNSALSNTTIYPAGFLAGSQYIGPTDNNGTRLPIHDPRMTPYLGQGSDYCYAQTAYPTTYWRGYVSQQSANLISFGDPAYWPDGSNTNLTTAQHGIRFPNAPINPLGLFANAQPAPCKISNAGSYSNIFELGNIFDPIQWAPPNNLQNTYLYSATNIDSSWNTNNLYGGGSTLRIGRPEHPRFAFTNLKSTTTSQPIPNTGQSAAAFLDLFCISNPSSVSANGIYRTGGKINLNTAPAPVLAALAGGIKLTLDPNKGGSEVNTNMISAFTNGVMRFRSVYPFLSSSQLAFISANYGSAGWTNSEIWTNNAVFSAGTAGGLNGVTGLNDQGREEWFSKIYELASVSSVNYRFYIAAQLVDTNFNAVGPIARKYCQYAGRPDTSTNGPKTNNYGIDIFSWTRTTGQKKVYESPY